MAYRVESKSEVLLRVKREFDAYSDGVLLTELEASAAAGLSFNTLKFWRHKAPEKAPRPTYLNGCMVRYTAGAIRAWRAAQTGQAA